MNDYARTVTRTFFDAKVRLASGLLCFLCDDDTYCTTTTMITHVWLVAGVTGGFLLF